MDNHGIEEVNEKRERDELLFTASDPKAGGILLPRGMKVKWALGGFLMASYRSILACLLPGALFIGLVSGQSLNRARASYPLKISLTGRYLIDQDSHPFLISGDSADALLAQLLPAEADMYFANREANGFNVIWFQVLTDKGYGGRANGSTADGIVPFTTSWDFSTPNEAYFARLDDYVNRAGTHGLTTFLDPIETGGLIKILRKNGETKAFHYGVYLGNRYRNFKNIVWLTGNDYKMNPDDDLLLTAVIRGIKSVDPSHLHTSENNSMASGPGQTSLDDSNIGRLLDFNGAYVWTATYLPMYRAYHQSTIPAYLNEGNFEEATWGGELGTPQVLRRQAYWATLSGGVGQLYGNRVVVWFLKGWQNHLNTVGVKEIHYWKDFFASRAWYTLVPDQAHAVVTAGYGTLGNTSTKVSSSDYLTAARSSNGRLIIAYTPVSHSFTVDMTKLSGKAAAQWFDPANGTYKPVQGSPLVNVGTHQFTSPGSNSAGDSDWVLVLEVLEPGGRLP